MWNLPAPPGFIGFDDKKPVRIYHRHLPHWRQEGVTYFVTFRLADSLPREKLNELEQLKNEWKRGALSRYDSAHQVLGMTAGQHEKANEESFARQVLIAVDRWLDQGSGECLLRQNWAAAEVVRCLQHHDGKQFDLCAFVVMPNHVHVLARPYSDAVFPLERLVQGWKSYSAKAINQQLGRSEPVWQDEFFDRIIRDEEHLYRCLQYIGSNPRRAGLAVASCLRYVRPEWQVAGWDFIA